jgi:hypothetical protein
MTRDHIIQELFTGKNFNDCIGKMEPVDLREDLKMEVIAVICEWSEEKVKGLYLEGKLEFYVVRVIINMLTNKYSPFYKKFRTLTSPLSNREFVQEYGDDERHKWQERRPAALAMTNMEIAEMYANENRSEREEREDKVIREIDSLHWYSATMLKLYMEKGNYRALEEATGIPFISCYKTVQKAFKELKSKVQ